MLLRIFVCFLILTGPIAALNAKTSADLIFTNGRIYTADNAMPWAEAVAIAGERILAVGSAAHVCATANADTKIIDLGGAFVSPGFNDGHVHIDSTGQLITGVNLLDVHEPDRFVERIRGATRRLPIGSWIIRGFWGAYEQWGASSSGSEPGKDQRGGPFTPDRRLIDPVTPEHPVLVSRFDRSMVLANTLALKLAGITADTPEPRDGKIERDTDGRLTGILRGSAVALVADVIPPISFEQRLVHVRSVLKEAREGGVTTMQDLTNAEQLRAYQTLKERGELTCRIMVRPNIFQVESTTQLGITRGFGDNWLKFIGYKAWVDEIMGNSSAMFFRPYDHDPSNRGALRKPMMPESVADAAFSISENDHYTKHPPGTMEKLIDSWVDTGIPAHVHAIGDLGNRILLDIYTRVLKKHDMVDLDHRWRIIHAQVVHPDDFARFGELNLVAEINPYHVSDDMRWMPTLGLQPGLPSKKTSKAL